MCHLCSLDDSVHLRVWERLTDHYGLVRADISNGKWADIERDGFIHSVWIGLPLGAAFNLLCVDQCRPVPESGLIPCNKVLELLDSPHGFDEAITLYMYERAIRRM